MEKESLSKIFFRFLRFGFLAWGGPIAQIAMLRKELVEEEQWISGDRFNRALAVYQALPGPEAHELCVYFGMVARGRWGAFLAGLGFMLPGFIFMLLLTWFYIRFGISSPVLQAVFTGFQAAVIALIFSAVHRIGKHSLLNKPLLAAAGVSAIAHFCGIGFYMVLPIAGVAYVLWMRKSFSAAVALIVLLLALSAFNFSPEIFQQQPVPSSETAATATNKSSQQQIFITGLKGGLLTFGGAYTVIPFIQEDAVIKYTWMSNRQFLDGIALSGIIPAPLIIFSAFAGYFGGGWLGAFIIIFAIFLPSFCFTMFGYKYLEKVIENAALRNFLDGVTAGVIGLIAVTAIQLFRAAITDASTLVIFFISLIVLYKVKSKFAVVFVIIGSGIISYLWSTVL